LLGTPKGVKVYYGDWYPANNYGQEGFPINALLLSADWNDIALAAGIFPENNGFIQASTDVGLTWENVFNLPLGSGRFNQFFQRKDSSDIFLALNEGLNYAGLLVADAVNDPGDWQPIAGTTGLNFQFPASFPGDLTIIYFLVNDSLLYKSEDGGRTVQFISVIPGGRFNSIYAVEHYNLVQNIYACGQGIKYSSDYGITWNDAGLDQYQVVRLIYESTSMIAATRNNGFFAKYHSTGDWVPFSEGFGKGKVINDALNFTTWVLHTATENHSVYYLWLIINDVERKSSLQPGGILLSRNYPNPFNPSTRIDYSIGSRQFVTIKIFDLLGREIATLVNEEKPAGIYELTWNAAGLPSGVYFYQLRAGSFIQTKKMILLR
jgi:hypothetical protein